MSTSEYLYELPPAVWFEFCRLMDGLSETQWVRFGEIKKNICNYRFIIEFGHLYIFNINYLCMIIMVTGFVVGEEGSLPFQRNLI